MASPAGALFEAALTVTEAGGLWTDAYKPRMAQMGWALRPERAVYSFRRGGPFYIPIDMANYVRNFDQHHSPDDYGYLASQEMYMDSAYRAAMGRGIEVSALPEGSWFTDHEPILTLSAPSARWSNLEGRLIGELAFIIQVGTLGKLYTMGKVSRSELTRRLGVATCEQERGVILGTLARVGVADFECTADPEGYYTHVYRRAQAIIRIVGNANQIAEGGLRSATCPQNHAIAVAACRAAGWTATSNLFLSRLFDMTPAGTTGHEHTQRYFADAPAFRAAIDRAPGNNTLLLDTYDTQRSGIPAAIRTIAENPGRLLSMRPDYEPTQEADTHLIISGLQERDLDAGINLSGGFDDAKTRGFLALADAQGFPRERMGFLYGEYVLKAHVPLPARSGPAAVLKLCESGGRPTMKHSGSKSSKPGRPVVFRRVDGAGPGIIGQQGEDPPAGYRLLTGAPQAFGAPVGPSINSPATANLVARCTADREHAIAQTFGHQDPTTTTQKEEE